MLDALELRYAVHFSDLMAIALFKDTGYSRGQITKPWGRNKNFFRLICNIESKLSQDEKLYAVWIAAKETILASIRAGELPSQIDL